MPNELKDGQTRLGALIDGNEATPENRVTLERRENVAVLRVPWEISGELRAYAGWFAGNTHFGDDPERTRYEYEVPNELWFRDKDGLVHLIGCRFVRSTSNLHSGIGEIQADFVVFDKNPRSESFASIKGLRSSVSGLRSWLNTTSIQKSSSQGEDGLLDGATYELKSPKPLAVEGVAGLTLVPHWKVALEPGAVHLLDELYVQTEFEEPRAWNDHLQIHRGIRDLLAVSQWRSESITGLLAKQDEDRFGSNEAWRTVHTDRVDAAATEPQNSRRDLVAFSDIGIKGISRWYEMRDELSRAIDPIVSSRYLSQAPVETLMSQAGIGLEALGFLVAKSDLGMTERQAGAQNYVERFKLIADALGAGLVPFDIDAWPQAAADGYNAVKHANRTLPDLPELANCWRESLLIFRCWVALKLGVEKEVLADRVQSDPMAHPYA
ncbi:hypothetical protein M1843_03985 [Isoptericola sp. 4D.3]|uniref:ApeA N-terminal domain-containing protein n=1 Tax=Isoptericola peretonis TaxID=2918523 RepID=A0ABT0J084_9MICO|nr:hypothetical protein [Isoptericola sp. 4D.3]